VIGRAQATRRKIDIENHRTTEHKRSKEKGGVKTNVASRNHHAGSWLSTTELWARTKGKIEKKISANDGGTTYGKWRRLITRLDGRTSRLTVEPNVRGEELHRETRNKTQMIR